MSLPGFFMLPTAECADRRRASEHAGDFTPLRFIPKGTIPVLGLVSSKEPTTESRDALNPKKASVAGACRSIITGERECGRIRLVSTS